MWIVYIIQIKLFFWSHGTLLAHFFFWSKSGLGIFIRKPDKDVTKSLEKMTLMWMKFNFWGVEFKSLRNWIFF